MTNDEIRALLNAQTDQAEMHAKEFARIVAAYRLELEARGVEGHDANEITYGFQELLWWSRES